MPCLDVAADATPAVRRTVARSRADAATQDAVVRILAAATIPAAVPMTPAAIHAASPIAAAGASACCTACSNARVAAATQAAAPKADVVRQQQGI